MDNHSLFELEKDYYLGNYQSCVNKANSMEESEESNYYLCLSYFHLKKYDLLEHELSKSKMSSTEYIRHLLSYTRDVTGRDAIIGILDEVLDDKKLASLSEQSRFSIAAIYVREKMYSQALQALNQLNSLPAYFLQIGVYLLMNRTDLAERHLKSMQNKDDFATLTLLALAQVRLASGLPKEAYDIAKELEDKYRATPLLNNLQTAAAIGMGRYDLAKLHCENSLDLDSENPEALINMIHILTKLRASTDIRSRNYGKLKALYPSHEFVKEMDNFEVMFES